MLAAQKITLKSKRLLLVLLGIAMLFLLLAFYFFLPVGHEWSHTFRPAALRLIQGISPYNDQGYLGYYNSPWLLLPIIPFALLPEQLGYAFFTLFGLLAFTFIAYRCKVKSWFVIPILLSYPVTFCLYRGQVDWLVLLGITLPPQFGLLLVLAKPQIGIGIAVYWLISAFRIVAQSNSVDRHIHRMVEGVFAIILIICQAQ